MGKRSLVLALGLALTMPAVALAQTTDPSRGTADEFDDSVLPESDTAPEAAEPEIASVEAEVEATLEEASEPVVSMPPGYEHTAVPTPPVRAPRQASDEERASTVTPAAPVSDPSVELAITINGLLNFSGTTTPVLVTAADLALAIDARAWIGFGIAFSYSEQHSGSPDMKFVTSSISVPLVFQYYFDTPHVGAAVPTLRVHLTPGWSEQPVGGATPSTQLVTASAALLGGITWMGTPWLALRIIGGVSGGFGVNVVGPVAIVGNAGVQALVSAVIRF